MLKHSYDSGRDMMFYSKTFQSDIQIIHKTIMLHIFLNINFTFLKSLKTLKPHMLVVCKHESVNHQ